MVPSVDYGWDLLLDGGNLLLQLNNSMGPLLRGRLACKADPDQLMCINVVKIHYGSISWPRPVLSVDDGHLGLQDNNRMGPDQLMCINVVKFHYGSISWPRPGFTIGWWPFVVAI